MAQYFRIYENESKGQWYRKLRAGYISVPVNRSVPNPYTVDFWWSKVIDSMYPTTDPNVASSPAYTILSDEYQNGFGLLEARCYDSIYRAASGGKRAAAGITLLEWKSSLGMIADGAGKLYRSAKHLRKGNMFQALRELNISDPKRAKRMTRQYGDGRRLDRLWLELNFGWGPLMDDIRQMCAVMAQSVPTEPISSSANSAVDRTISDSSDSWGYLKSGAYGVKNLRYRSTVKSVNPNILLAKQLGLTNPLQVAWDAVPMSFVVDWFLPINKYLSSFDLSLGIELGPLVISKKCELYGFERGHLAYPWGETRDISSQSYALQFRRTVGGLPPLPSFKDRIAMPTGSLWQAATTIALATTQLITINANLRTKK